MYEQGSTILILNFLNNKKYEKGFSTKKFNQSFIDGHTSFFIIIIKIR